jgi:hypothetical protein
MCVDPHTGGAGITAVVVNSRRRTAAIGGFGKGERKLALSDALRTGENERRTNAALSQQSLEDLPVLFVADELSK